MSPDETVGAMAAATPAESEARQTVLAVQFAKARRRASFDPSVDAAEKDKQQKAVAQVEAETMKAWMSNNSGGVSSGMSDDSAFGDSAGDLFSKLGTSKDELRDTVNIKPLLPIGAKGAEQLAELVLCNKELRCLEVLSLANSAIGDVGTVALADALQSSTLSQLDLAGNSIKEAGISAIARALTHGKMPRLIKLSLKSNDIHDAGATALASASHDALEWLALSHNQISDEGGSALAVALGARRFGRLRRLSLDHNRIGDGAMGDLASVVEAQSTLEELYVACNAASQEATRRVQRVFGVEEEEDDEHGKGALRRRGEGARGACEAAATSLHRSGCVCM